MQEFQNSWKLQSNSESSKPDFSFTINFVGTTLYIQAVRHRIAKMAMTDQVLSDGEQHIMSMGVAHIYNMSEANRDIVS